MPGKLRGYGNARPEVVAVGVVRNGGTVVDVVRTALRLIAHTIVPRQTIRHAPGVCGEIMLLPIPKASIQVANARGVTVGDSQAKIRNCIASEIVPEIVVAAIGGRFAAIELETREFASKTHGMTTGLMANNGSIAIAILHPIEGNSRGWAQRRIDGTDLDLRSHGIRLWN